MSKDRAFEVQVMAVDYAADLEEKISEGVERGWRFCLNVFGWILGLGGAIFDGAWRCEYCRCCLSGNGTWGYVISQTKISVFLGERFYSRGVS